MLTWCIFLNKVVFHHFVNYKLWHTENLCPGSIPVKGYWLVKYNEADT